jgi:hypothetical protein
MAEVSNDFFMFDNEKTFKLSLQPVTCPLK